MSAAKRAEGRARAARGSATSPDDRNASPQPQPHWHRAPDLVDAIMARAGEPWARLTLGGEELVAVRRGGNVVVIGPTGSGKSSLVCSFLVEYARDQGPVVVMSRELPADELMARAIGLQCDASWVDVLRGRVSVEEMRRCANLPRMFIADRQDATLATLTAMIRAAQAQTEYRGEVVLAAVDYVQIVESDERETRAKVTDVIVQIDEILRAQGAVGLLISQMSRTSSRAARNGEAIGADSTDGGAESAAIERTATVTLSIGQSGAQREDETCAVDLSIGKHRLGGGDEVFPATYNGRTGRWRLDGPARPASEAIAAKAADKASAAQRAAEMAILGAAGKANEPQTRDDLSKVSGKGWAVRKSAIAALLASGDLVEVRSKVPRARGWRVWTPDRARAAGLEIISPGASGAGSSDSPPPASTHLRSPPEASPNAGRPPASGGFEPEASGRWNPGGKVSESDRPRGQSPAAASPHAPGAGHGPFQRDLTGGAR